MRYLNLLALVVCLVGGVVQLTYGIHLGINDFYSKSWPHLSLAVVDFYLAGLNAMFILK